MVKDPADGPSTYDMASTWTATAIALLALLAAVIIVFRGEKRSARDRRNDLETEILSKLLDTVPPPEESDTAPLPLAITDDQFRLVAMLTTDKLPFWRDYMTLVGQASSKGEPIEVYIKTSDTGEPKLNRQLQELWYAHGFAPMRTAEQTIAWLLRRDVLRALGKLNGRKGKDVDAWLELLYGGTVYKPGERPTTADLKAGLTSR